MRTYSWKLLDKSLGQLEVPDGENTLDFEFWDNEMHWYCEDNDHFGASYLSENLCDEMLRIVRAISTSSSSWYPDHISDSGLYVFIVFWSDFVCIVDWLLQWSKDYSDTTVFGWPTLWMSNRTFCSTLRFEAVRCYLYVDNWFGDGTLCSDDVLYSEEHCTEDCEWITSFLNSNAVRLALASWLFTFGWEPVCFENFWKCFDVFITRWICRFVAAGIVSTNFFFEEPEVC